jgi:hypothetical protein
MDESVDGQEEPFPEIEWIEDDENNVNNAMLIESICQSSNDDYTQRGGLVRSRAFADGLALLENRQLSQVSLPSFFQPIITKESSMDRNSAKSLSLSSLVSQALFVY